MRECENVMCTSGLGSEKFMFLKGGCVLRDSCVGLY